MSTQSTAIIAGLLTSIIVIEPVRFAFNKLRDEPTNQKCEAQLPELIKNLDLPGNGSSRYNPWLRQCHYKYFKDGEISTYKWYPDLK